MVACIGYADGYGFLTIAELTKPDIITIVIAAGHYLRFTNVYNMFNSCTCGYEYTESQTPLCFVLTGNQARLAVAKEDKRYKTMKHG